MLRHQMVMVKYDDLVHLRGCGMGLRGYYIIQTIYFHLVYDRLSMYIKIVFVCTDYIGTKLPNIFIMFTLFAETLHHLILLAS